MCYRLSGAMLRSNLATATTSLSVGSDSGSFVELAGWPVVRSYLALPYRPYLYSILQSLAGCSVAGHDYGTRGYYNAPTYDLLLIQTAGPLGRPDVRGITPFVGQWIGW